MQSCLKARSAAVYNERCQAVLHSDTTSIPRFWNNDEEEEEEGEEEERDDAAACRGGEHGACLWEGESGFSTGRGVGARHKEGGMPSLGGGETG